MSREKFQSELDQLNDPDLVRTRLKTNSYDPQHKAYAEDWLERRERKLALETSQRKEEREVETLKISKKSLRNSNIAIFLSIVALIVSVIIAIYKWNHRPNQSFNSDPAAAICHALSC